MWIKAAATLITMRSGRAAATLWITIASGASAVAAQPIARLRGISNGKGQVDDAKLGANHRVERLESIL